MSCTMLTRLVGCILHVCSRLFNQALETLGFSLEYGPFGGRTNIAWAKVSKIISRGYGFFLQKLKIRGLLSLLCLLDFSTVV